MIYKSALLTQASGSVNGLTFSRNAGGAYIRSRTLPVNPNTPLQQIIRQLLLQLVGLWGGVLTAADRLGWATYSTNVPMLNALGDSRPIGGMQNYIRSNVSRLMVGLPRQDKAPQIFNTGDYTAPTVTSITAPSAISLAFAASDEWANETGSALIISASRPQNPTINFFKGPYQFAGAVLGDSATPPTSPAALTSPFAYAAGQQAFLFGRVTRSDGRLSSPFRLAGTAI